MNESMNQVGRYRAARAAKNEKKIVVQVEQYGVYNVNQWNLHG